MLYALLENENGVYETKFASFREHVEKWTGKSEYLGKINTLHLNLAQRDAYSTATVVDFSVNGERIGDFKTERYSDWMITDLSLEKGFKISAVIVLEGKFSTSQENSRFEVKMGVLDEKKGLADLLLTSEVNNPLAEAGSQVVYYLKLHNDGPDAADVTVQNILPDGATYLDAGTGQGSYDATQHLWHVGTLDAGATTEMKIAAQLGKSDVNMFLAQVWESTAADPNATAGNLNGIPAEDDETASATNAGGSTSGGNNGGMESNGDLAGKIATRNFTRWLAAKAGLRPAPERFDMQYRSRLRKTGSLGTIMEVVPELGPDQSNAVVTTPHDLIGITNALEVFSVDYTKGAERYGVVLAIATPDGSTYEHTKVVCDRLSGAELQEVSLANIGGKRFVQSKLVHANGDVDYAITLVVYQNGNAFQVESRFGRSGYQNLKTGQNVLNFQVWSKVPQFTQELVASILSGLGKKGTVSFLPGMLRAPSVYVKTGQYTNGKLTLALKNRNQSAEVVLKGVFTQTEGGTKQTFWQSVSIPQDQEDVTVELPIDPIYDLGFTLENNQDAVTDELYVADGTWGFSADPSGATVQTQNITPASAWQGNGKSFGRNISFGGTVKTWAAAFRVLQAGARPVDLTAFNAICFNAKGTGEVKIVLEKAGISNWDHYATTIRLSPEGKTVVLDFNQFKRADGTGGLTAEDLTQVVFYVQGDGQTDRTFDVNVEKLGFVAGQFVANESEEVPTALALGQNFPNPFNPSTSIRFTLDDARPVTLKVYNLLGREVATLVQEHLAKGEHTVTFDATALPSGTYLYRLQAGTQTLTRKMTLLK